MATWSGERLVATYRLAGDEAAASALAGQICNEQTVEFPDELIVDPAIREHVLGRVVSLRSIRPGLFEAAVSYAVETAGEELPQLVNLVFGNASLLPGVRLERLDLPESLLSAFRGPRFGRAGLRSLVGAGPRPLTATALKPMGLPPSDLARQAAACAEGGIDLVKDDHGLANQAFCPFEERVARCAEAVLEANARSSGSCLYAPNVTARAGEVEERARFARRAGAGALVVAPGLTGLDALRRLAEDDAIGLPLLFHPAGLGSFTVGSESGISRLALFGQLARLAGADACIFPHYDGRFAWTRQDCREVAEGTARPMGPIRPSLPAPAGGVLLGRVAEICDFYGGELIVLVGGDLHRHGAGLTAACRSLGDAVDAWAASRPTPA
jgi:ribulose-bisphosphate carboxylase large chain